MFLDFKRLSHSFCTITTAIEAYQSHPKVLDEYLDQAIKSGTFPFSVRLAQFKNNLLQVTIANEYFDATRLLLDKCLKYERYEEVLSLLYAQDSNGRTPLLLATLFRNSDIVKTLIDTERHALDHLYLGENRSLPSLGIEDNRKFTPLNAAVILSSEEIVKVIIEHSDESFKRDIDIEKLKCNRATYHDKECKYLKRLLKSLDIDGDRAVNAIGNQFSICNEKDPTYGFLANGIPIQLCRTVLNTVIPFGEREARVQDLAKLKGITDKELTQRKENIDHYKTVMDTIYVTLFYKKSCPEYLEYLQENLSEHSFLDACKFKKNIDAVDTFLASLSK